MFNIAWRRLSVSRLGDPPDFFAPRFSDETSA
jgi:hypothetical protein